jgi:hypothetical protein
MQVAAVERLVHHEAFTSGFYPIQSVGGLYTFLACLLLSGPGPRIFGCPICVQVIDVKEISDCCGVRIQVVKNMLAHSVLFLGRKGNTANSRKEE